jgi:N-acyl amino acid synthase FeeM
MQGAAYKFKIASETEEFEQIHRLNFRTFVEEIHQHPANPDGRLVDKFHEENTYVICLHDRRVVGMLSVRANRPFSLDAKLENLDSYLPQGRSICEFRLLSVAPDHRNGTVFVGLLRKMAEYCFGRRYDLAVISGTVRQLRLYRHVGFVPFGHLVGAPGPLFQPMYLTKEAFMEKSEKLLSRK